MRVCERGDSKERNLDKNFNIKKQKGILVALTELNGEGPSWIKISNFSFSIVWCLSFESTGEWGKLVEMIDSTCTLSWRKTQKRDGSRAKDPQSYVKWTLLWVEY